MRPPEDRLFARYRRRRDARLLAAVFDRTAPALLRIARHVAPRRDLADDVLQQTFVAAIERADDWDAARGLFSWLVGILVNQARLAQRSEARRPEPERLRRAGAAPTAPDSAAESQELEAAIAGAVKDLGDTYRPVLHLHLFHGLNAKQIAAALDRPAGSVRTQLVRGLERLRRALPVGLAVTLAATGPALAATRRAVLAHAGATTPAAVGAAGALLLTLGGSTMKKWTLVSLLLVLCALGVYSVLPPSGSAADVPDAGVPEPARGELDRVGAAADDRDRVEAAASARGAAERSAVATTGSVRVRVLVHADDPARAMAVAGAWVDLWPDGSDAWRPELPAARSDDDGVAVFDGLEAGRWNVRVHVSVHATEAQVVVPPGEQAELTLDASAVGVAQVEVVDARGRPVAGAEVWSAVYPGFVGRIRPMEVTCRLAARTDVLGRARLPAGAFEFVGARKAGYAASRSSRPALDTDERTVLVLGDERGALRGEVAYDDGRPIADATVFVHRDERQASLDAGHRTEDGRRTAPPLPLFVPTDAAGRFAVDGLRPGNYRCFTDAANTLHDGSRVAVSAGETANTRIVVAMPGVVRGTLARRDGGPLDGVTVSAWATTGSQIASGRPARKDGSFEFEVARGPLLLRVKRRGEVLLEAEATASDDPEPVALVLDEPRALAGRLVSASGAPVANAKVATLPEGDPLDREHVIAAQLRRPHAYTDDDGRFVLYGLDDGPWTVFSLVGTRRGSYSYRAPTTVRRAVARGTLDLELVIPDEALPAAAIRLRVVGDDGAAIDGASVRMSDDARSFAAVRDGDGHVGTQLLRGGYRLEIKAPGHASRELEGELDVAELDLGDVALEAAVPLRVRPLLDGKPWRGPLPRPIVRTTDGEHVSPPPDITIEGPELVLDGLGPGTYELHPYAHDDLLAAPLAVQLFPGTVARTDWPMRIGRDLTLRFTPTERPAATARLDVRVRPRDGGDDALRRVLPPTADGTAFVLHHEFTPGKYVVTASRDGVTEWEWDLDTGALRNGSTVDVPRR